MSLSDRLFAFYLDQYRGREIERQERETETEEDEIILGNNEKANENTNNECYRLLVIRGEARTVTKLFTDMARATPATWKLSHSRCR